MIRATFLLTLALTVATGETATLMCQAVCDHPADDADACRHTSAAAVSITSDAACLSLGLRAVAMPRVELKRPESHDATLVAASNQPPITTSGRPFASGVPCLRVGSPPRAIALRI